MSASHEKMVCKSCNIVQPERWANSRCSSCGRPLYERVVPKLNCKVGEMTPFEKYLTRQQAQKGVN